MSIKDVEDKQIDSVLNAVGAVLKAIISVVKCVDDVQNKSELKEKPVV